MTSSDIKTLLRRRLLARRQHVSEDEMQAVNARIVAQTIQTIDWPNIHSLHSYAPISSQREVETWSLFEYAWQHWPRIRTAAAGTLQGTLPQSWFVDQNTLWQRGHPPIAKDASSVSRDYQFDVIIIPLIGFDSSGYRLGYGGGYYDRFLKTQQSAQTIGLGMACCFLGSDLPHEPHDIPLQWVITETHRYRCGR
ncbi:MAG TPA: 5-formyltetrahydrofolate cyclo-ligase [Candidatus Saccharimonadales bacterium]|nr:5-formyltetrahydrofolate cyclo-ligase [Candidatus Saccharimonadales bacterium]